jgi:hypothetical protein
MTLQARSGLRQGMFFYIEAKQDGKVQAAVNNEKQRFGTWKAAEQWIEDEIKRRCKD